MQSTHDKITDAIVLLYEIATDMKTSPLSPRVEMLALELNKVSKEYHEELSNKKMYDTSKIVIGL
jgi:hypothetical protein